MIMIFAACLTPWVVIFISGVDIQGKANPELFVLTMSVEYFFPFMFAIYSSGKFSKWFDSKLKQDEEKS